MSRASGSAQETQENRMNELIRELVEALEYSSDFLSRSASRFGDICDALDSIDNGTYNPKIGGEE